MEISTLILGFSVLLLAVGLAAVIKASKSKALKTQPFEEAITSYSSFRIKECMDATERYIVNLYAKRYTTHKRFALNIESAIETAEETLAILVNELEFRDSNEE